MDKDKDKEIGEASPAAEHDFPIAGFGHALHLLLMAIAKTNPSVGSLLDEFTSMHADYVQDLKTASGGDAPAQATDNFVLANRLIYKRLSDQLERQQANQRSDERVPAAASIH
ncbi:hypothetical protein BH11PSE14_BH11PSE14_17070 [soil metagenome]